MIILKATQLELHQLMICSHFHKLQLPEPIQVQLLRVWKKKVENQSQNQKIFSMMIKQWQHLLNS